MGTGAFCYICHFCSVGCCRDLQLIGEGGGVSLSWVEVHSAIYDTYAK